MTLERDNGLLWTPSRGDVAHDVRAIGNALDAVADLPLPALRALAVVKQCLQTQDAALSPESRWLAAVEESLSAAIGGLSETGLRPAARALFDFTSEEGVTARKKRAAELLPGGGRDLRTMNRSAYEQICNAVAEQLLHRELHHARLALEQASREPATSGPLAAVLEAFGVRDSVEQLEASAFEPSQCIARTNSHLWFLGTLGSKWVTVPHVRAEFEALLRRLDDEDGDVRFLLIDPAGVAYQRLEEKRERGISIESLMWFHHLEQRHGSLSVRLHDVFPYFRLTFIDFEELALARNKWEHHEYKDSRYGWAAPHLVLTANAPWALHAAFRAYFEDVWVASRPLPAPDDLPRLLERGDG